MKTKMKTIGARGGVMGGENKDDGDDRRNNDSDARECSEDEYDDDWGEVIDKTNLMMIKILIQIT